MSLVAFDDIHRRVWMFPRNIRKIQPWKVSQILSMIHMKLENDIWSGNQELQNAFTKSLEDFQLKRPGVQYDLHSGGARTYFAQLESLGLLFTREDNSMWLTIAGQDLVEGNHSPSEILRTQLLNYQYPSIYSKIPNVKIHPKIKIKPFLFILELLMDKDIRYLTDYEIIIPVIYGHNSKCFELCKEKILKFRENRNIYSVINNKEDLFTPRGRTRSVENAIKDFKDIANTCKNFLESCSLVISERMDDKRIKRIHINEGLLPDITRALENKDNFIPVNGKESFLRRYGAWNRRKDGRTLIRGSVGEVTKGEPIIKALFVKYAGNNLVLNDIEEFLKEAISYGFDRGLVLETIEPFLLNSLSLFEENFMTLASGGRETATEFEKAVKTLFEERLHYKAVHTGQRHRKGKTGGFTDIFLQEQSGRFCALVDTKASPRYNLSAEHFYTMTNSYIPSINELEEYNGEELGFCAYVAGGFNSTIDDRIKVLSEESGYNFVAIKAYDLLKLCQKDITLEKQEKITDKFRSKQLVRISDFEEV